MSLRTWSIVASVFMAISMVIVVHGVHHRFTGIRHLRGRYQRRAFRTPIADLIPDRWSNAPYVGMKPEEVDQ